MNSIAAGVDQDQVTRPLEAGRQAYVALAFVGPKALRREDNRLIGLQPLEDRVKGVKTQFQRRIGVLTPFTPACTWSEAMMWLNSGSFGRRSSPRGSISCRKPSQVRLAII